jgi:hypothetical protein
LKHKLQSVLVLEMWVMALELGLELLLDWL